MEKGRIYLSLPISGYDIEERRATAQKMEDKLLADGWQSVANPLKNGLPATASTPAHMRRDYQMMLECDAVMFMRKWNRSAGCHDEFLFAVDCGLELYFENVEVDGNHIKFK